MPPRSGRDAVAQDGKNQAFPSLRQGRVRLDHLLVARGLFRTRSRARDAILRGAVRSGEDILLKPGLPVAPDVKITLNDPARYYVSRAALKLIAALDGFGICVTGRCCADIGASTGGFTEVLLERGAAHVTAVDVGHGQMEPRLRGDARVALYEGLNARDLTQAHFQAGLPDLVVSDVSFISLKLALPAALQLALPGAAALLLVKPQFEAGRVAVGKGGLLKEPALAENIADELFHWLDSQPGWHARGLMPSPIEGGNGNREFLLYGEKTSEP